MQLIADAVIDFPDQPVLFSGSFSNPLGNNHKIMTEVLYVSPNCCITRTLVGIRFGSKADVCADNGVSAIPPKSDILGASPPNLMVQMRRSVSASRVWDSDDGK